MNEKKLVERVLAGFAVTGLGGFMGFEGIE